VKTNNLFGSINYFFIYQDYWIDTIFSVFKLI